ncbi:ATP-dependent DNA helicase RecG [Mucilaginibacter terrenus]|uniref:DNA 3'-5' helicase n=1 Tax=Mucilaginibacter terrenus TaxID=2482727 RepID=A0A3E2NW70_9SPHI|nr:DEAD/DEAH box helicase [Mucilaginibacter terrenus]RFZ85258.1 ATP-dependent DNA helicase RecG [Mucilaginibacter terrenus]
MDKNSALILLRKALDNPTAQFRTNQWEAIDQLVNHRKKLLVVERTGWGKSSVYFISTRILRNQGKGPTIIISPLLALMRNQLEAASRLGIRAVSINSTNVAEWQSIKKQVLANDVDALLISPERLANDGFMDDILRPIANRIGLFVVDEAHCISDWGHDFRTDYRRITSILRFMPDGMPVLGTTATANKRVMNDISEQLGNIEIIRGSLVRDSLILQNINLDDPAVRLAWLRENLPKISGSGIIYTLTIRDAIHVADYLNSHGIYVAAYYGSVTHIDYETADDYRRHLEDALYNNKIKALISTSALGMGYDKPDLSFVIHYQAPGSIIAYYQQVGRAGRAIDRAYGVLLAGREDEEIHQFFIRSAFPSQARVDTILSILEQNDGLSVDNLTDNINLRKGQIEQVLKYLSVEQPSPITKIGTRWYRTAVEYVIDKEKISRLTVQKALEWQQVQEYIDYSGCLMNFLQNALDDTSQVPCGRCSSCLKRAIFSGQPNREYILEAGLFLRNSEFPLEPRKLLITGGLPSYGWGRALPFHLRAEVGRVLSQWEDAGWGGMVATDKHKGHFRDELVDAMEEMIKKRWNPEPAPRWITCVPSNRHPELVSNFARRLGEKLGIPFLPVVVKVKETEPQKAQANSSFQCRNLDGVFGIDGDISDEPVILIDDATDSGWTFTIIAALLRQSGSGLVYPVALTSTSVN